MSAQILNEIKSGVTSIMAEQDMLKTRLDEFENLQGKSASDARKRILANGGTADPVSFILKMAAAQIHMREGRGSEAFELAGLSAAEKKLIQTCTQKAMDTGASGAGGGFTVPPDYVNAYIQVLRAKSVVLKAGATLMEGLTGSPVMIPKQLTSASAAWYGQNQTLTATDPSFGQVQMTPKTLGVRAQYSNLLGMLASPSMEKMVRDDFAAIAGLELDRVALRGSGAANQPLGLNGVAGINTVAIGTNGGNLDVDTLYALMGTIEDANALGDKLALITNPKGVRKLKKQRIAQYSGDTGGIYIVAPLLTDESLSKAIGLTCLTSTQIPFNLTKGSSTDCTEVYVGNWSELLIGLFGSVELLATNIGGNAWAQNAIEVRLIQNCDVAVRHSASFVYCADASTAYYVRIL
jgi:HK97 family phage major capsid protein